MIGSLKSIPVTGCFLLVLMLFIAQACRQRQGMSAEELERYRKSVDDRHADRLDKLRAPNGWLNLVGLHWLEPGENTFGSDSSNTIVFPAGKIAPKAGYFLLEDTVVTLVADPAAGIRHNGAAVGRLVQFHPDSARPIEASSGTLRWTIIRRESRLGIRLRDDDSELLKTFAGVERFPIDPELRVTAHLQVTDTIKTIAITNVLGQTTQQYSPGTLVFSIHGKTHRLDVLDEEENFFIVFADSTTGEETYGGGRFLYVSKQSDQGEFVVDFNQAINPPCVFTPYATCPLPPRQNRLPVAIRAGEKNYGEHY